MTYESNLYREDIITIEGEKYCIKYDGTNPPVLTRVPIGIGDVVKITDNGLIYATANKILRSMTCNEDYYIRYAYGCRFLEIGDECVVLNCGEDLDGREVYLVRRKGILDGAVYIMGKNGVSFVRHGEDKE